MSILLGGKKGVAGSSNFPEFFLDFSEKCLRNVMLTRDTCVFISYLGNNYKAKTHIIITWNDGLGFVKFEHISLLESAIEY